MFDGTTRLTSSRKASCGTVSRSVMHHVVLPPRPAGELETLRVTVEGATSALP